MKPLRTFTGAIPFLFTVFLNAFIDLGHKIVIQNTLFKLYDEQVQIVLTAILNGLILLPFILLLSPAGFFSDRFKKVQVMQASAWFAVFACVGLILFYYQGWFIAAFAMTFLLAAQSAIYSPAKFAYIKELFGKERLGEANGLVAGLSIVAILAGIFFYTVLFEYYYPGGELSDAQVLQAIAPIAWFLLASSVLELVMMYRLPSREEGDPERRFDFTRFICGKTLTEDLAPLSQSKVIRLSIIGLATFWSVGQVMLAAFPAFLKTETGITDTIVVQGILACSGLGIALGSIVAGRASKNHIETGLLPIGALGIALGLLILPYLGSPALWALTFLAIGFSGGMFIVPLNALIQFHAEQNTLGKTLAANNWVQNVSMLSFLVVTITFALVGFSSRSLLQLIAIVALVGCCYTLYQLPQSLTRFLLSYLLSHRYRVSVQGMKHIPAKGGALLLGNHVSWIDWAVLQIASPRPVRFVMIRNIYERWYLKWFFDMFACIPIEQGAKSRHALERVAELLKQGELVCLFPEGTISRTGHLATFRKGYEKACEGLDASIPIIPFYLRGLWGSQFSRSSARLKSTSSRGMKRDIIVAFGKTIANSTTADVLKRRVFDLSISSWNEYLKELPSIGHRWVESAKSRGGKNCIADTTGVNLSAIKALSATTALASKFKRLSPEQNIGVLLPTSAGGVLCNMALMQLGKTVVNLNYTASPEAICSAIEQAEIKTIYTSERFLKKLSAKGIHIEPALKQVNLIYLEEVKNNLSLFKQVGTYLFCMCMPTPLLKCFVCRRQDKHKTAAILFSSGSEGAPKGVQISHTNIMTNVKQTADVINTENDDVIMANLPLFHAFGLTVTQFMPLLEGIPVVYHPDPTDALASAKAIASHQATILFGTSTFFRIYNRNNKVHPLMLSSLKLVVSGAEKLNQDVRMAFKKKFNKDIYEGYGATETTPVASVNLPDKLSTQDWKVQQGNKVGSVGMPLPGTSCKIVDPATNEELATGEAGMILIGGNQVMQGYINNPQKTQQVIKVIDQIRWYVSGDKGYLDEDGFLYIIDRYSRFAKVGGEMLSLSLVEDSAKKAAHILKLNGDEFETVAVALKDEKKGEKIVLLYSGMASDQSLDEAAFKEAMLNNGLTPLSLPANFIRIDEVPKLGSGKVDFSQAKRLAEE